MGIGQDLREVPIPTKGADDPPGRQVLLQQRQTLLEQGAEIGSSQLRLGFTGKVQELPHRPADASQPLLDHVEILDPLSLVPSPFAEGPHAVQHAGDGVVDLVGDSRRHLAQRRQMLRPPDLLGVAILELAPGIRQMRDHGVKAGRQPADLISAVINDASGEIS